MAILLRHTRTGLFYARYKKWTPESDRAFNFKNVDLALNWIRAVHLYEVEIVRSAGCGFRRISQERLETRCFGEFGAWNIRPQMIQGWSTEF